MKTTEILKLDTDRELIVPNKSGFYHDVLKKWWDELGLRGTGLIVGDKLEVKSVLKEKYPEITEVFSVELSGEPDIEWDITKPFFPEYFERKEHSPFNWDWIICQAVLEHVVDPVAAMKNMSSLSKTGGFLYLYVPGPECGQHRFPLDCYRFFKDALVAFQELASLKIIDLYCDNSDCMVLYERI